jgi:hypothetical protein
MLGSCADNRLKQGVQEKQRAKNCTCGNGVPQCVRHLFIAAPLHSDKSYDDECGRDDLPPDHVWQLNLL